MEVPLKFKVGDTIIYTDNAYTGDRVFKIIDTDLQQLRYAIEGHEHLYSYHYIEKYYRKLTKLDLALK